MRAPTKRPQIRGSLKERFERFVERGAGCWEWRGAKKEQGYGVIGRGTREEGTVKAHRAAWEIYVGPIPAGRNVLHQCDNPGCVNPAHLFLGSLKDNSIDCALKGRQVGGVRQKLTPAAAREIREWDGPQREMMEKYGISQAHVSDIRLGRVWEHLGEVRPTGRDPNWGKKKLTADDVRAIRAMCVEPGDAVRAAEKYGLNKTTVYKILSGRHWKNA